MDSKKVLRNISRESDFFIGVDSDGCVFDTMEIKQKECFCPNFIRFFHLQTISKYARETWEFVNLYSKTRGLNRFLALIETVKLLEERPEVKKRGAELPDLLPLLEWTKKESKLSNLTLEEYATRVNNPLLDLTLRWSQKVNDDISNMVIGISPFPYVKESLEKIVNTSDMIVVSQTPLEALEREWEENKIDKFAKLIAGQELGTKTEHLKYAAKDKYEDDRIMMIGDAPGDLRAARDNGVLFFPVNPGHEEESWERFHNEGLNKFLNGKYKGDYERMLIEEFESYLPELPPWKK
ncbi:MAG: HAD family hydrolase [Bacteroidales bacterium]